METVIFQFLMMVGLQKTRRMHFLTLRVLSLLNLFTNSLFEELKRSHVVEVQGETIDILSGVSIARKCCD